MKLLLHACCGPCCCFPTEKLTVEGRNFDILFFNPNIHPYKEFKLRLSTLREFCAKKQYNLIVDKSYPIEDCIRGMLEESTIRCAFCYRMRLRYVASFAVENGYDAFSTTLLVSPYQKHELIKQVAEKASKEFDIPFYYEDYRGGYERGVKLSLELGLYRQQYCGCVFSERDRYEIQKKTITNSPKDKLIVINRHLRMVNPQSSKVIRK